MKPIKNFVVILVFIVSTFPSFVMAQSVNTTTVVDSKQLFETFKNDKTNPMTNDFCQEITVTIDVGFVEIQTTIIVCCSTEIFVCIPNANRNITNENNKFPNEIKITNSERVTQNGYQVSVIQGVYKVSETGQILGLRYKIVKI